MKKWGRWLWATILAKISRKNREERPVKVEKNSEEERTDHDFAQLSPFRQGGRIDDWTYFHEIFSQIMWSRGQELWFRGPDFAKLWQVTQCGKTRNSLTSKIFRQINSLVTYLFNCYFHEIFAKYMRDSEFSKFPQLCSANPQCEKTRYSLSTKKIVKLTL